MSTIHMQAVAKVVDSRHMAGEDSTAGIIVVLCIVHDKVKLNGLSSRRGAQVDQEVQQVLGDRPVPWLREGREDPEDLALPLRLRLQGQEVREDQGDP
ncbi:hypothetical protein GN956_G18472 [Arapaima gigas]